jgi:alpha-D-xyloside xylohydrolase
MFSIEGAQLLWQSGEKKAVIEAFGDGIRFLMFFTPKEDIFFSPLEKTIDDQAEIKIEGAKASLLTRTGLAVAEEADGVLSLSLFNLKGEKLTSFSTDTLEYHQANEEGGSLKAAFKGYEHEKLFGMGQYQHGKLNLKGMEIELAQHNMQVSIPYVVSNKGYGIFWNNPALGTAVFKGAETVFTARLTDRLDFWLVAGDDIKSLTRSFNQVCGKPEEMPEYGLGFWQSRLRYWNQQQIEDVVAEYQKRQVPLSVIICDFYHYPKLGDMHFDSEFYPDPHEMVAKVNKAGVRFMISYWPHIDYKSENFADMQEQGLLAKTTHEMADSWLFGKSIFFDVTNPETMDYVWDKCKKNYWDLGIKNFWLDEIEPDRNFEDPSYYSYMAGSHLKLGNLYPLLNEKGFYEKMQAEGEKNPVNLCRCAWAGSERYGSLVWSGDVFSRFSWLANQIPAGINIGLAGISWWNTDIGGFQGGFVHSPKFKNLLIRWFEFGAFSPVMRLHGNRMMIYMPKRKDGTKVLFSGQPNEIWSYGEKRYEIMKKYIFLREKMKPYLKKIYKEASVEGDPLIRGLFYEFPQDQKAYQIKDEYMFGPSLLIAPVLKAFARGRKVYLPQGGEWYSTLDKKTYQGGQTIHVKANLDQIPVFCLNGEQKEIFE